jgi:hypothetical protein
MFLVPIPENWDPVEHDWRPADGKALPGVECFLRGEVATPSCGVLTLMRSPETQQRVAWYGPPEQDRVPEQIASGVLFAAIGITADDWRPEDRQVEVSLHG